ncbi:TMEM175 family protein [Microbacterium sp. ZW T5_45]|uniref:TMEM175 family protein n=1 Tax=Microbacterium sp. ZW T5_45 TaxID=3378080 RepID=UPI00385331DB
MTEKDTDLLFTTERFTAFVDAVVAIAMTLLILPLMESVSESTTQKLSTAEFLSENGGQLLSFGLSFALIATFWLEHHRLYSRVHRISVPLLWLNIAWMLTIVWLPVATAMLGQMTTDPLQAVVYIGTLILTQVATLTARVYLIRHAGLSEWPRDDLRRGVAGDIAAIVLFLVAMALAAFVHSIGYLALLLVILTRPLARVLLQLRE